MPNKTATYLLFLLAVAIATPPYLHAHSGRTDASGGHTNRKTGEYHYHSGSKTTSTATTSRQGISRKTTTRKTKVWVAGDGTINVGQVRKELHDAIETFTGKVVGVSDGDTIKVMHNGKQEKIRLYGIDTPEKKQAFGQAAKRFTADMVAGKEVSVEVVTTDRYGRTVGVVKVGGVNLNEELVWLGYAWVYDRYCKASFCTDWKDLEENAKDKGDGLWGDPAAQAPWEWRRERRK